MTLRTKTLLSSAAGLALGLAMMAAAPAPAAASDDDGRCRVTDPNATWLTKEEVAARLKDQGFDVRRMDTEDGCLEMKGMNKDGKRVEVYVHPVSGEIVNIKRDD